jgi:hypothetical protein
MPGEEESLVENYVVLRIGTPPEEADQRFNESIKGYVILRT